MWAQLFGLYATQEKTIKKFITHKQNFGLIYNTICKKNYRNVNRKLFTIAVIFYGLILIIKPCEWKQSSKLLILSLNMEQVHNLYK